MPIGDTHGANMVALCKKHFDDRLPIGYQLWRFREDFHAFLDHRGAAGEQARASFDLDDAQTASTHIAQAVQVAQGRNVKAVFARDLQDRFIIPPAHLLVIDLERDNVAHWVRASDWAILQTPAGHRFSTMWARYSWRK